MDVSNYQLSINNYQLPEGYKQTEVGMIPEDWEVSSVGQEFEIQLGKMLDAEKNTGILKPYIGNRAVQWGYFDVSDLSYMAMSRSDLEKFRLEVGDLIVCEGGEVGRSAIWDAPIEECYYQKALHRLRVKNNFNSQLMVAFLKYWTDFDLLSNYVSQTSIAHLTKEKFSQVPLPIPSTKEQRAIAATLSDVDALIAALDNLIAKQRHLKTATMQQLLTGKKRLPGFGGAINNEQLTIDNDGDLVVSEDNCQLSINNYQLPKGYKQTEVGLIPEDWDFRYLGEDAVTYSGGTPLTSNQDYYGGDIPWITSGDLNRRYISNVDGRITEKGLKSSSAKMVPANTLLIALYGATAGVAAMSQLEAAINQAVLAILPKTIDKSFLFYLLSLKKEQIIETYTQGGQPNLSGEIIRSLPIAAPNSEEQRAIATVLSDIDAAIAALEARRAKTQAIKQGMMQELLTGKTRLV